MTRCCYDMAHCTHTDLCAARQRRADVRDLVWFTVSWAVAAIVGVITWVVTR